MNASVVVSNADPRTTYLELLDPKILDLRVVRAARNIKFRGKRRQNSPCAAGDARVLGPRRRGCVRSSVRKHPDRAYYDLSPARLRLHQIWRLLGSPLSRHRDPDPNGSFACAAGQHTLSITAKYVPYALREASWQDQRAAFTDTVLSTLSEYVPKIRDCILHEKTLLPGRSSRLEYGLPEGNGSHGEMTLDQFLHMRPSPGPRAVRVTSIQGSIHVRRRNASRRRRDRNTRSQRSQGDPEEGQLLSIGRASYPTYEGGVHVGIRDDSSTRSEGRDCGHEP